MRVENRVVLKVKMTNLSPLPNNRFSPANRAHYKGGKHTHRKEVYIK